MVQSDVEAQQPRDESYTDSSPENHELCMKEMFVMQYQTYFASGARNARKSGVSSLAAAGCGGPRMATRGTELPLLGLEYGPGMLAGGLDLAERYYWRPAAQRSHLSLTCRGKAIPIQTL